MKIENGRKNLTQQKNVENYHLMNNFPPKSCTVSCSQFLCQHSLRPNETFDCVVRSCAKYSFVVNSDFLVVFRE